MAESTKIEDQLQIRRMSHEDVPEVFDLEQASFQHSSWTIDAFYYELEQNNFAHYFVLEYDQRIIGYLGLWVVVDQAQVTTIAIDAAYQGHGLGQMILKYGMNYVGSIATVMSLEVRVDNVVAQHVYRKLGFQFGGKRKNYYGDGEDALVMWVNLYE